jgi:hypothetical protein
MGVSVPLGVALNFGFPLPLAALVRAMATRTEFDTFGPLEVPADK